MAKPKINARLSRLVFQSFAIIVCLGLACFMVNCDKGTLDYPVDQTAAEDADDANTDPNETDGEETPVIWSSLDEANWDVAWTGYGLVSFDDGIVLTPDTADSPGEAHSALVVSQDGMNCPFTDFRLSLTVTTEQQLRTDTEPYPWEVFWVFFNYDSEDHQNIRTNYFIFKTNGIELGRFESPDQQTFLATDDEPLVVVGTPNEWVLEKTGQLLSITIDGVLVMTYNGGVENEALFDHAGSIGLYTEDAQAHVTAIEIQPH